MQWVRRSPGEGPDFIKGCELSDGGFGFIARRSNGLSLGIDHLQGICSVKSVTFAGTVDFPIQIGDPLACFGFDLNNQGIACGLELVGLLLLSTLLVDFFNLVIRNAVITIDHLAIDQLKPVTQKRCDGQFIVAIRTDDTPVIAVGKADFIGHDQLPPMIGTM